jgi:hypothetical protein
VPTPEPAVLICTPASAPLSQVIPGSTTTRCRRCRRVVWLAPSSLELLIRTDAVPVCMSCLEWWEWVEAGVQTPNPDQVAELRTWHHRPKGDR